MRSIEHLLLLGTSTEKRRTRYLVDAVLAIICILLITLFIRALHLYPFIPNISFLYLLLVLGLASTRGLYAASIASIAAFLSFDYFLVMPLHTFTVARYEEWLALFVFLFSAIVTGQLASALRQRAELATQRESETRTLYELVNATLEEETLERQLHIVAQAIVKVFAFAGVRDCAILLSGERGKLVLQASASQDLKKVQLSADEETVAASVLQQGEMVDLHCPQEAGGVKNAEQHRFKRLMGKREGHYIRMIPLRAGERSVGVVRLLIDGDPHKFPALRKEKTEERGLHTQAAFFWTFLDQATVLIERERLRRENLQIELLRRTDALRSALLSSVSHDLRTPLSSIKAAASSLLQQDVQWSGEERSSFALTIEREADRLNRLVGNLLDMSRIEGGALKPEKEWYPVDELIRDVLERMQPLLGDREVRTSLPENLPPVELDYLQMDQVLTNLIENAVRYTPAGSPIEISAEVKEHNMLISVGDYGPGILERDLKRVFDKFYRVLTTKRKGTSAMGSGLGLAVCRGLVEAHGGRIWVQNREQGCGAIFRFTLPLNLTDIQKRSSQS
jgi:two-component system sensor histidine kinase KdpD